MSHVIYFQIVNMYSSCLQWRTMIKAIRVHEFGGPEVMKLEEVPRMSPGPNEAVIEVKAVGVNPVETYIRAGTYARKPSLPFTPG